MLSKPFTEVYSGGRQVGSQGQATQSKAKDSRKETTKGHGKEEEEKGGGEGVTCSGLCSGATGSPVTSAHVEGALTGVEAVRLQPPDPHGGRGSPSCDAVPSSGHGYSSSVFGLFKVGPQEQEVLERRQTGHTRKLTL